MNKKGHYRFRDFGIGVASLVAALAVVVIIVEVLQIPTGYGIIAFAMVVITAILLIDRAILLKRYRQGNDVMKSDLKLKEILYDLLQKTSCYSEDTDLYSEILKAAIDAVELGDKGSIIDIRNPHKVSYVAVEGFKKEILEAMGLGLKDTYLYKETKGTMDRTVIIRNSVNYNQLHANDGLVRNLIEAGTAAVRSTICTPIVVQGRTIGMINIDSSVKHAFSEEDIQIIEIFALEVGKMIRFYEIMKENLYLSRYDAMTKIYNRGYFYDRHKALYRETPIVPYIFVSTDIDNLKKVNDSYGHLVGDQLINRFVEGIKDVLPEDAVFGRYGGDEFNILLPNCSSVEAQQMMARAQSYYEQYPIHHGEEKIYVSFSHGIVSYPEDEEDYEQLIIKADKLMYAHKYQTKEGGDYGISNKGLN